MYDFNGEPAKLYGIFPNTPFPIEVSIYGLCSNACFYCFANLNRIAHNGRDKNPHMTPTHLKAIQSLERAYQNEKSPLGFFLREKYPICFSNTTDPFMREEKIHRASEAFLKWARGRALPLYVQTKGTILVENEEFARYSELLDPSRHVIYITIPGLDDDLIKHIEPGAPLVSERIKLVEKLTSKGFHVVVAPNPYLPEWLPNIREYVQTLHAAGAEGIWMAFLHFSESQKTAIPAAYRKYINSANVPPGVWKSRAREWLSEARAVGMDFFTATSVNDALGWPAEHPEAANPEWFGKDSKVFSLVFDIQRALRKQWERDRRPIIVRWADIVSFMQKQKIKNPVLKVDQFWIPYNARVNSDYRRWRYSLGSEARFYEILRYFWNHFWENSLMLWESRFLRAVSDEYSACYIEDVERNVVGVYDPSRLWNEKEYDVSLFTTAKDYARFAA
ncbi:MAG: hypothetical protein BWY01_01499 [Synergistetes bacterium ADurb.Bin155]|nr:MAG: hypothetical protein BWY01_01499 [Synergistetes bacterium ADurb.Bin155]